MTDLEEQRRQAVAMNDAAAAQWADAIRAHILAPPDPGFAGRLRALADAAKTRARAARVADAAGMRWVAQQGALYSQPPYELRSGSGRPGPTRLWVRFDDAVLAYNRAIAGTRARAVGDAADALAEIAAAIADEVDQERAASGQTTASRRTSPARSG